MAPRTQAFIGVPAAGQLGDRRGGGLSRDNKTREIKSEAVGHANFDHIHEFAGFVIEEIDKKASKKYPDRTTLIVNCMLNIFDPDEWGVLVTAVRDRLPHDR